MDRNGLAGLDERLNVDMRTGGITNQPDLLPEDSRIVLGNLADRRCKLCAGKPAFKGPSGLFYACPCTQPVYDARIVAGFGRRELEYMDRLLRMYWRELKAGATRDQLNVRYTAAYDDPVLERWRADVRRAEEDAQQRDKDEELKAMEAHRADERRLHREESQVLPDFKRGKNAK